MMGIVRVLLLSCLLWCGSSLQQQLLVYGLGNVGRAVANGISDEWIVRGTKRLTEKNDPIVVPLSAATEYLSESSHVLITIPPVHPELSILKDLSEHLKPSSWVGFVSTSGVYGNHDGAWVTEESPLLCKEGSSAFEYARFERELMEMAEKCHWNASIFRCTGLYGKTRSALHTLWKQGLPTKPGNPAAVTNRVHETDVARAIVSAMEKQCSGIYNLGDDEPEARSVVMDYAADLLASNGMAPSTPIASSIKASSAMPPSKRTLRRTTERKLVKNDKMKAELVDHLSYRTYKEGLEAILQDRRNQWWNTQ